jgi:hypothetical protein
LLSPSVVVTANRRNLSSSCAIVGASGGVHGRPLMESLGGCGDNVFRNLSSVAGQSGDEASEQFTQHNCRPSRYSSTASQRYQCIGKGRTRTLVPWVRCSWPCPFSLVSLCYVGLGGSFLWLRNGTNNNCVAENKKEEGKQEVGRC